MNTSTRRRRWLRLPPAPARRARRRLRLEPLDDRVTPAGAPDLTFGADGKLVTPVGAGHDFANAMAVQADGKVILAGQAWNGANDDFALVRYHPDGSLDRSFGGDGIVTTPVGSSRDVAIAVAVQVDGKIVVAGDAVVGSADDFALVRYLPDGSLDLSFGGDGKVTTDFGGTNDTATAVAVQADGKIVAAGYFFNGTANDFALVRYLPDGSLDLSFGGGGRVFTDLGSSESARAMAVQADGRIVVAGESADVLLARYRPDGSLDPTFGEGGMVTTRIGAAQDGAYAVAVPTDGRIVVAGATDTGTNYDMALVRYRPDGSLDRLSDGPGRVTTDFGGLDVANAMAVQADGKIVAAGYSTAGTTRDFALARYNPDGSLDTSFGGDGTVTTPIGAGNDVANAVAVQADGKIVVVGSASNGGPGNFALARYLPDGSLDLSFGGGGTVSIPVGGNSEGAYAVAIQPNGKIVAAGSTWDGAATDFALARFHPDGSLDLTFDGDGKVTTAIGGSHDRAFAVAVQADGKIVAAGYSSAGTFNNDFALVRYRPDGSLDPTFDGDGKLTTAIAGGSHDSATAVAVQPDGRIVAAGSSFTGADYDFALVRYLPGGSLDPTFHTDGKVTTAIGSGSEGASDVALQPDGRIVAAGSAFNGAGNDVALARYLPDGSLDPTFDGDGKLTTDLGGIEDQATAVAVQPDGRIVAAGYTHNGSNYDFALIRVRGDNRAPVPVSTTMTLAEDTPLTVTRPAYFYDPDSDVATTELLDAPDHGTLTLTPYGTFTYTPDPGFCGTDRFAYKVSDAFGGFNVGSVAFTVTPLDEVKDDPTLPGRKSLYVTGTDGNDTIVVKPVGTSKTAYQVTRNGGPARTFTGVTGRVHVNGLDGNDAIQVKAVTIPTALNGGPGNDTLTAGVGHDSLTGGLGDDLLDGGAGLDRLVEAADVDFALAQGTATANGRLTGLGTDVLARNRIEQAELTGGPGDNRIDAAAFTGRTWLRGGGGDDTLRGGSSHDLLLGGDGIDDLDGGGGRDVLIGGVGADFLTGGAGEDILVGGTSAHDGDAKALDAILAEWTSGLSYATRVRHLLGTLAGGRNGGHLLNAVTVPGDGEADRLTGGLGLDWFLSDRPDTTDRTAPEQDVPR